MITPFNMGAFQRTNATAADSTARSAAPPPPEAVLAESELPSTPTPAGGPATLDLVRAALRKANINPSVLNLYYEEIPVYFPGGGYVNRFITCELPTGAKESYDVNLAARNPWLTAFEIGRLMGYRA